MLMMPHFIPIAIIYILLKIINSLISMVLSNGVKIIKSTECNVHVQW